MNGVITATILSDGNEMDSEYHLMSIDIIKAVNKIPSAQLILLDGDAAKQEFKISDTEFFKPGKELEIKLRYEDNAKEEATVFKGIILRHSLQADQNRSLLTIESKDAAFKLIPKRKSAVFRDMTDKDIIEKIVQSAGLQIESVATTQPQHKEMVQFGCTDWDFIVSRADVNGHWVLVDDGKVTVIEPNLQGAAEHKFEYGISEIYDFEMEADSRFQYESVESTAWDVKNQDLFQAKTAPEFSLSQGNLNPGELAQAIDADTCQLLFSGQLDEQEVEAWAKAKMVKSRLSLLKGRLTVPGLAKIKLGDIIEVAGIGKRFNGKTLVTAIRHQVTLGGWQTNIQFGLSADWFSQNEDIIEPPVAGLIPAINGLQIGVVDKYEDDPDKQFRVKVKVPSIETDGVIWARLASLDAGNERGIFFRPEEGDEVILGFVNDDPRQAVILGAMHSEKNELPSGLEVNQENYRKGIVTKESLQIIFDDEDKFIEISTPNGNLLRLSDQDKGIYLEDENGNTITIDDKGFKIKSDQDIIIEGKTVTIKGSKVDVN
ncbi:MAG: type VI secretion system tip protein VgrG [Coleofasciculus chthonoplastes F3-SA18-01]|uniref:type VI secretion system tip protein VgrG n=1 Tax=Coleofasciculus TaxID=669368 RepID=UPI0032F7879E